jgi:hypothetical protein
LIHCALISGPPLILSAIAQALAMWCAATLPRHRFRALTCLVSLGFASAGMAIALTLQPFEVEQEIDIDLQVIDQVSGRPIAGAFLCITDAFSDGPTSFSSRALADVGGCAILTGRFVVSGQRNAFQSLGTFSPWGQWLEVSAVEHRTIRIPLTQVLGLFADPDSPRLGKVALARGKSSENSFGDLAGTYSESWGFSGMLLKIELDGRFACSGWGCAFEIRQYGYLKRHGGQIELVPIPH